MAQPTLDTLLAETATGDAAALHEIYRRTSGKLLGVILAIVGSRATAEEVLRDVYLAVWQQAEKFEIRRARPMTWLITIARNRAIHHVRSAARRPQIDEATDLSAFEANGPTPEKAAVQAGDASALRRCLGELKESQSVCIQLAYWRGYSHAELAELFGKPRGTVKSWTRRGLQSLRECLGR